MPEKTEVTVDRRNDDRRAGAERREQDAQVSDNQRQGDRRKTHRRRQIDPTTCERDYTNDEIEFMQALDDYKRRNGRMFPTCSEILEVIRDLGYCKAADCELTASEPDENIHFDDVDSADAQELTEFEEDAVPELMC